MIQRLLIGRIAAWLRPRAQPAPLDADIRQDEFKAALDRLVKSAVDSGVSAERKRIGEIMAVPGASRFAELAVDLAVGGATAAQVAMVISSRGSQMWKHACIRPQAPQERTQRADTSLRDPKQ